jgi:hypothetical protein
MGIQAGRAERVAAVAAAITERHGAGGAPSAEELAGIAVDAIQSADLREQERQDKERRDRAEAMRRDVAEGRALSK